MLVSALAAAVLTLGLVPAPARADLAAENAQLITRLNEYRQLGGLQPVAADEQIAQAALNHSLYWGLNGAPTGPLGYHEETPGNPGYTGQFPPERCAATGAACESEVMGIGVVGAEVVDVLMDSVYHRQVLLGSYQATAGGAWSAAGFSPIDLHGGGEASVPSPLGFPVGQWNGPLSLINESPDPIESCNAQSGQPAIGHPGGTPVTWQLPSGGEATAISLRKVGAGSDLPGCADLEPGTFGSYFIPAAPLEAYSEYEVSLAWTDTAHGSAARFHSWRFSTGSGAASGGGASSEASAGSAAGKGGGHGKSDANGATRCAAGLRSIRVRTKHARRYLDLRLRLKQRCRADLRLKRRGEVVAHRGFAGVGPGRARLVLPIPRRVPAGRATVLIKLVPTGGRRTIIRRHRRLPSQR